MNNIRFWAVLFIFTPTESSNVPNRNVSSHLFGEIEKSDSDRGEHEKKTLVDSIKFI